MLGAAIANFHMTPEAFWQMTMMEFWAAHFRLYPEEERTFTPFTEEEQEIFERMPK